MNLQIEDLVGTWRRFGPVGPVYEVMAVGAGAGPAGDETARIKVVETGEEIDYSIIDLLDDPRER